MPEFVGDFQNDVGEATALDPLSGIYHTSPNGGLVLENLILTLIEAAEDHNCPEPVAHFDYPPDARSEARHSHTECGYHDDAQFGIVNAMVYFEPVGNVWARSGGRNARFASRVS